MTGRSCVARLLYTPAATLVSAPTRHSVIRGGPPTETSRAIICISPLCQTVFLLFAKLYFPSLLQKLYFSAALKPISFVLSSQTIVLSTRRNKTALVRKEKGFLCNLHLDSTNSVSWLSESDRKTNITKQSKCSRAQSVIQIASIPSYSSARLPIAEQGSQPRVRLHSASQRLDSSVAKHKHKHTYKIKNTCDCTLCEISFMHIAHTACRGC